MASLARQDAHVEASASLFQSTWAVLSLKPAGLPNNAVGRAQLTAPGSDTLS